MPEIKDLDKLVNFASSLADASGSVIEKYYRNFGNAQIKDDKSPVTIADRETESAIRNLIQQRYPNHGIMGEEFGYDENGADFTWVIDPIDGTKAFTIGRPLFTTLIGLLYKGEPMIGIIDQPILKDRWIGVKGKPTTFNSEKTKTKNNINLANAIIATTAPEYFKTNNYEKFTTISKQCAYPIYGGDAYNYGSIASGLIDIAIDESLQPHDYLPIIPIIEGAGGIITDWNGKKLSKDSSGNIIIAANEVLFNETIKHLK